MGFLVGSVSAFLFFSRWFGNFWWLVGGLHYRKLMRKQLKMQVFQRCVYSCLSTAKKLTFQVLKANLVVITLGLPALTTFFHHR